MPLFAADLNADPVTPMIQALATLIAAHLTGLGHVYDLTGADPAPDQLTRIQATPPDVLIWLTQVAYDSGLSAPEPPTRGPITVHYNRYTLTVTFVLAEYTPAGSGLTHSQAAARRWPHALQALVTAHTTLSGTCWQARVDTAVVGPWTDLNQRTWQVVQVPVLAVHEVALTTGST